MFRQIAIGLLVLQLLLTPFIVRSLLACPFCSAPSKTFGEEIESMDVVLIARLVFAPPRPKPGETVSSADQLAKSRFEIVNVITGEKHLAKKRTIEVLYFGDGKKGQSFLIMGVDPPKTQWSTPTLLSERAREYVLKLMELPRTGAKRLEYFQNYLEDKDEMLARDAYDEFAKAPYSEVHALKDKMDHAKLVSWIKDPDIPASRRRLYLTMLGIRGSQDDAKMLAKMLESKDRKIKAGLDAMIASYLTLQGPSGMPLVEELFLKNKKAEYADTYAAIMALRFHGTEAEVIPKKRILEGLRHMLDRPELADLVIVDLARMEDWSVMSRLVKLFKDADEESSWVRVPIVRYLMVCPKPEAKEKLAELQKIDPGTVKRAQTFFPFGGQPVKPAKPEPEVKTSSLQ